MKMVRCIFCNKELLAIKKGQIWENNIGHKIKILDIGIGSFWCEWENGGRDALDKKNFLTFYKIKK